MISTMSKICKSVSVVLCAVASLFTHGAHAQSNSNPATSFHQLVMPEKPLIVTTAPYRAKLKR